MTVLQLEPWVKCNIMIQNVQLEYSLSLWCSVMCSVGAVGGLGHRAVTQSNKAGGGGLHRPLDYSTAPEGNPQEVYVKESLDINLNCISTLHDTIPYPVREMQSGMDRFSRFVTRGQCRCSVNSIRFYTLLNALWHAVPYRERSPSGLCHSIKSNKNTSNRGQIRNVCKK